MTDDQLRHLCKLSTIAVSMIRDPSMKDVLCDGLNDPSEAHNTHNCLSILADAFVELQARQVMKPHFGKASA
jgi:hypothetical protein